MAWPALQQIANTAVFAIHGEPVTYTPPGGVPQTVTGIFGEEPRVVEDLDGRASIFSSQIVLALRQADLTAGKLENDATVVIRGVTYDVRGPERPDDSGVVKCFLRRVSGA